MLTAPTAPMTSAMGDAIRISGPDGQQRLGLLPRPAERMERGNREDGDHSGIAGFAPVSLWRVDPETHAQVVAADAFAADEGLRGCLHPQTIHQRVGLVARSQRVVMHLAASPRAGAPASRPGARPGAADSRPCAGGRWGAQKVDRASNGPLIVFRRIGGGQRLTVVANFGDRPARHRADGDICLLDAPGAVTALESGELALPGFGFAVMDDRAGTRRTG